MAKWTANDIPDLSGKTAVVTGANSGLGYETAAALARHGAHVVLACRDERRGTEAIERLRTEAPDASVELSLLDLADLTSVRKFAEGYAGERSQLDILVNNAGVMALDQRRQTADGFEMQLGTNHLGHFALTGLLLPQLQADGGGRVVNVTSFGHKVGKMNFDDLQWERSYKKWLAYGRSKLANLLFTFEFDRRARAAGSNVIAAVAHPGYANTNLQAGTSFAWSNFMAQPA
ncbi:MAG: SDR family NAD(P)-dependent oxidoreductase, partial [Acidimicrobiia bacterium]|nr:SDR family NAD(P)-dependent oxidoreductase [Acidimicrobiia bacterium]